MAKQIRNPEKPKDFPPPFFNSNHPGDNVDRVKCVARFLDEMFAFQSHDQLSEDARAGLSTTLEWIGDACEVIEGQIDREIATERQKRDKSIELMRDLLTRLYTVSYYIQPDETEEGKRTKKQAIKALDGIYDLADEIQKQLGIGGIALFEGVNHG